MNKDDLPEHQGPGEEDGPWAEGWEERSGYLTATRRAARIRAQVGHLNKEVINARDRGYQVTLNLRQDGLVGVEFVDHTLGDRQ